MSLIPLLTQTQATSLKDEPKFGKVIANNDPEQLGKIKVIIPGIFEGAVESLPWIRRKNDTSFCGDDVELFDVPSIGSIVEIKWNYDENTPMYSGAPNSKRHMSDLFRQNYPYEGGIKFGDNYIKFDKQKPEMTITNGDGNIITLSPEGKTTIQCNNLDLLVTERTYLKCTTFDIEASDSMNIKTNTFNLTDNATNIDASGNMNVTTPTANYSETVKVGTDTVTNGISFVGHTHTGNLGNPTSPPNP